MNKKYIITGHARSGKDTVCDILRLLTNLTFISSSYILLDEVIYPVLKDKYGYKTRDECYERRGEVRNEWFDLLVDYNKDDLARLGKLIFNKADIYCGLRNINELKAMRKIPGLIDKVIWVDASNRIPPEDISSCTITADDCDYILDNNIVDNDLIQLHRNIKQMVIDLNIPKY